MKSKPVLIVMLSLMLLLSMLAYGAQQATPPEIQREDIEKLNAQVTQLNANLRQLQESVRRLEARVDELYKWTLHPLKKG